ncbi:superoxide dismutase [Subsaxibacter sp. CAU 1640]|uniref:superoxide dismutase n=1 Tax=Subsaxibacter sp. CAU 1640 TaxID=2933271 RepID=UPI002004B56B|nr:superoxide dismutase [Subsaxibacter sp. CAU 1640]MCK7589402.1 superoxide dismutase [Subsaxibacter sp. CAU 1640]
MAFELPKLKYAYDALEPNIDARTMEIHHTKHHQGYTNNLNSAIEGTDLEGKTIENILINLDMENKAVRNNGGGFYNHSLFWEVMNPENKGRLSGELKDAIEAKYKSFDAFKDEFSKAAASRFGSGWAWLCVHKGGKIEICSTPNQDNPLMPGTGCGGTPILGLDVWEHAYYLNYQNRRPDYINAFFNVINWNEVERRYAEAK